MAAPQLTAHGLLVVFVACIVVLLTGPEGSDGQAYHNIKQLRSMVSTFRGLKNVMKTRMAERTARINNMTSAPTSARSAVVSQILATYMTTLGSWASLDNMFSSTGYIYTSASRAMALEGGSSPLAGSPYALGNETFDRGMGYNPVLSKAVFMRAGVYVFHIKVQTNSRAVCNFNVEIRNSTDNLKRNVPLYVDWEVAPFFLVVNVQAGDSLVCVPLNCNIRSETLGTQMSLHYIDKY